LVSINNKCYVALFDIFCVGGPCSMSLSPKRVFCPEKKNKKNKKKTKTPAIEHQRFYISFSRVVCVVLKTKVSVRSQSLD